MSRTFHFDGEQIECPVCQNSDGSSCKYVVLVDDNFHCNCDRCGHLNVFMDAYNWLIASKNEDGEPKELLEISGNQRDTISKKLQEIREIGKQTPITSEFVKSVICNKSTETL